ncbi:alpha/beta fold hydrolase [Amycolatopsis azurea]|uniref:AB hydrolase-1 domain-containing protein n=1 Tax=Amycolatopsis azurea DSM 43854 TaxID=1238180 RepID=M2Q6I2_9PSEU|nr:alpha/beta hydrolase [Amycolatopsis azurea]EMD21732.1 hypothetical protein C791_0948 [Amycolatopsis azurea DSM 43854]OOC05494.1 hypothetical protein B0293_16805 [Amycolatopsis azurea DSM 43854]
MKVDVELIAELVLDEPAHLVGLSYGAIVALLAAARRPETVRSSSRSQACRCPSRIRCLKPCGAGLAP